MTIDTQSPSAEPKAILCGLNTGIPRDKYDRSMKELGELARACGLDPVETIVQAADAPTHATYIGSGKVKDLKLEIDICDADIVIFNEALAPLQVRNLEDALDTEVLDRTGIILQIFSSRARTREAKLQVESARLAYMLPRLAGMRKNLSRQGGGSGRLSNKGAGEEKIELDRRHIERQIYEVNRELDAIEKERRTQRAGRSSSGLPQVSLVGYTNAGKSTLMNRLLTLTGKQEKQVFEKDMLFATLDTQVRRIAPEGHHPFLLSDTVGFIQDLPHTLVQAFRSTLDEVKYADLLLEVVDCSDPEYEDEIAVTAKTLEEIGAGDIPILYVMNKADLVPEMHIPQIHRSSLGSRIYMDAKDGVGMEELLSLIDAALEEGKERRTFLIPYDKASLLYRIRDLASPEKTEYTPDGIEVTLTASPALAGRIEQALSDKE